METLSYGQQQDEEMLDTDIFHGQSRIASAWPDGNTPIALAISYKSCR